MRWTGHAASMGENKSAYKIFVENPQGRSHYENLVDERILTWISKKYDVSMWTGSDQWCALVKTVTNIRGSINFWEFLQ
jgi:hypothetical protein